MVGHPWRDFDCSRAPITKGGEWGRAITATATAAELGRDTAKRLNPLRHRYRLLDLAASAKVLPHHAHEAI